MTRVLQASGVVTCWEANSHQTLDSSAAKATTPTPTRSLSKTKAALSIDAVGGGNSTGLMVRAGAEPLNKWFMDLMKAGIKADGMTRTLMLLPYDPNSDHQCFFNNDVPSVTIQTLGAHNYGHSQDDDITHVNDAALESAARMSWSAIRRLATGTEGSL